ncbi:MAG: hypothetical protein ACREQN_11295 [Candidatus Binataceae bacterium]
MLHLDDLLTALRAARDVEDLTAIREIVAMAVAHPPVAAEKGDPHRLRILHNEDDLMVIHVVVPSGLASAPHEHRTWAAVGVYEGQEDNRFYRRLKQPDTIERASGRSVCKGDVLVMGSQVVHEISNPRQQPLMALHVYGRDLAATGRMAWDRTTFKPEPFDPAKHGTRMTPAEIAELRQK